MGCLGFESEDRQNTGRYREHMTLVMDKNDLELGQEHCPFFSPPFYGTISEPNVFNGSSPREVKPG